MDFSLTPEQQAFRAEIREFLAKEVSPSSSFEDGWITGYSPEFSRKLGARGWIGLTWPKKYGGQGKNYPRRALLGREPFRLGGPRSAPRRRSRPGRPAQLAVRRRGRER